jgi:hypothetical protein
MTVKEMMKVWSRAYNAALSGRSSRPNYSSASLDTDCAQAADDALNSYLDKKKYLDQVEAEWLEDNALPDDKVLEFLE